MMSSFRSVYIFLSLLYFTAFILSHWYHFGAIHSVLDNDIRSLPPLHLEVYETAQIVDVVISCDSNQRPGLYTLINSILTNINSKSSTLYVHLLVATQNESTIIERELNILFMSYKLQKQLMIEIRSLDEYPDFDRFFAENARAPSKNVYHLQKHTHSVMTYARIYLPEIFTNVNKAIFLDIDIVFNADIYELYKHDTMRTMIWFVFPNDTYHDIRIMINRNKAALIDLKILTAWQRNIQGFNAGLFLYNLTYWRDTKIRNQFEDIILYNKNLSKTLFNIGDQSVLHIVFERMGIFDDIGRLNTKWNVLHLGWMDSRADNLLNCAKIENAHALHYNGAHKPWLKSKRMNYRTWIKYLPAQFNNNTIHFWNEDWVSFADKSQMQLQYDQTIDESQWIVNWTAVDELYDPYIYLTTANISNIISWRPSHFKLYHHSVLSAIQIDQSTVWVIMSDEKINWRKYVFCAFDEGTVLFSNNILRLNSINDTHNKHEWIIECNVPWSAEYAIIVNAIKIEPQISPVIPIQIPSNIDNVCSINSLYKYNLSALVVVHPKESNLQLRNWIQHHIDLGIQHFIFYVDNPSEFTALANDALTEYINLGTISNFTQYNKMEIKNIFTHSCFNDQEYIFSKYLVFLNLEKYIIPHFDFKHLGVLDMIRSSNVTAPKVFPDFCKYFFEYCAKYEWSVNWSKLRKLRAIKQYVDKQLPPKKLSDIVSYRSNQRMYCGPQHYPTKLSTNNISYLQVHEILLETNQNKLWILIINSNQPSNHFALLFGKYLLCAFSDGSTVISERITMHQRWDRYAVVRCDVPKHLIPYILHSTDKYTNISVALINSIYYQYNERHTFIETSVVTLPVCRQWEINTGTTNTTVWHSIGYNEYRYNMSACAIVRPIQIEYNSYYHKQYDQAQFVLRDWIEYNLHILGIEHFVFYQHIPPEQDYNETQFQQSLLFEVLMSYIKTGTVTYIPWYTSFDSLWIFQQSMLNSCLKRFGHTKFSKYLMFADVDEYIIPPSHQLQHSLLDLIHTATDQYYEYSVFCNLSISCPNEMGCANDLLFDTVLQRHRCIFGNDMLSHRNKPIVEALKVKLMFTHYVEMFIDEDNYMGQQHKHKKHKLPHTISLEDTVCVHAKSNIFKRRAIQGMYSDSHATKDIDNVIKLFQSHIENNVTIKQKSKLLPLFKNLSTYCGV